MILGVPQVLNLYQLLLVQSLTGVCSMETRQQFGSLPEQLGKPDPRTIDCLLPAQAVTVPVNCSSQHNTVVPFTIHSCICCRLWQHRYCLGKPCAEYSSTFEAVQLRLELATRCAGALAADPTAAAGVVRHRVLNGLVAGSNGAAVHPQQLSEAAEFLAAQMAALHQVR